MKKLLSAISILLIISLLCFLLSIKVLAVTLSPSNLKDVPSQSEITINILASPREPAQGIELRLKVKNAQILSYSTSQNYLVLSGCKGSPIYTLTDVCADIVTYGGDKIEAGESIGLLTIKVAKSGTVTIIKPQGNQYTITYLTDIQPNTGNAGIYKIKGGHNVTLISALVLTASAGSYALLRKRTVA